MSLADKFGISQGLFDAAKKALEEANEYQKKVQAHMAKKGIKSLNDMTDDQKKKFFNELDSMHKAKNEEVDQIDELSKDTLKSYKHKAGQDARAHSSASLKAFKQGDEEKGDAHFNKSYKRMTGVAKSIDKLQNKGVKEEVEQDEEQIDELSQETLRNYHSKAGSDLQKKKEKLSAGTLTSKDHKKGQDRVKGLNRSAAKMEELQMGLNALEAFMQTEDFDQLDELSKTTLGNYIKKRQHDVATMGAVTRKHAMDSEKARQDQDYNQARKSMAMSDKAFVKGWKHRQNIAKAVDKLTKEDLEFIEALNKGE